MVAPLPRRFGVRVAYAVRFDNLPEPGFRKTDRVFTSGQQVTFQGVIEAGGLRTRRSGCIVMHRPAAETPVPVTGITPATGA